jgi:hypothetical protein
MAMSRGSDDGSAEGVPSGAHTVYSCGAGPPRNRVGIRLRAGEEQVTTAVQFADDTEVVLDSMEKLSHFLQCMDVSARASGQQLNLDKVELLPIGLNPGPVEEAQGMRVVQRATALKLPFTYTGAEAAMDWQAQKEKPLSRFERISSLHLSVSGRATAAAAYGLHGLPCGARGYAVGGEPGQKGSEAV